MGFPCNKSLSLLLGALLSSASQAQLVCPSTSALASSCRDDVCVADVGETAQNCPGDCADRSTQLISHYTLGAACPPTVIHEPQSIPDLQDTVRSLVSSGRKIKPAGTSHSATDIICGDANSEVIRSKHLDHIGPIEAFEGNQHTVEIESGVQFQDLQVHLATLGYSHGLAATGYGGVSIAGAVATGSHGSSLMGPSTISSYVIAMDVVGPDGNITSYSEGTTGQSNPTLWAALRTNLGLLGFVVRLRLALEPQFNIHAEMRYVNEDTFVNTPTGVADAVAGCDYVFLTWYPGVDTVQLVCGARTDEPVDSNHAQNRLFTPALTQAELDNAIPGLQLAMCDQNLRCSIESYRLSTYQNAPPLVITDSSSPDANIVSRHTELTGPSHRMITIQKEVFKRDLPEFTQLEYEGALPMSEVQAAVQYLKSIYDRDGSCQHLTGTIMRFDVADENLLMSANHARPGVSDGEKMVHLEFVEYWGYELDEGGLEKWVSTPYTEIITHLVDNFDFWPHWGKNDEWVFTEASVMARNAGERATFNRIIAKLDPYGVFSTAASRRHGFRSPKEGRDFAQHYYGNCASQVSEDGRDKYNAARLARLRSCVKKKHGMGRRR
jgi:hypothetical protein